MPKVSVILLNWNGFNYTQKCIESVKKQSFKDFELIVVDNGSSDGSVEKLRKISGIKLIENEKNLGFAGGNNIGVKNSSASEYVALLNNDTIVDKDWLKYLVDALDNDPKLGVVMSKFYDKYSKFDYAFEGFGTSTLLTFHYMRDEISKQRQDPVSLFYASGGSMLYRKSIAKLPFDNDYFIYLEDVYFSWLCRLKGYEVAQIPNSTLKHEGGATVKSFSKMSGLFMYLGERNRIMNHLIFYSPFSLIRLIPLSLVSLIVLNLSDIKRIPTRTKSYFWLLFHIPRILSKRSIIQKQRKVSDSQIFKALSYRLFDEKNFQGFTRFVIAKLNSCSKLYCKLVGIKTYELVD